LAACWAIAALASLSDQRFFIDAPSRHVLILRSARSARLEGWDHAPCLLPTLRDAPLCGALQGEVFVV
jgi:hypothetical protein